MYCMQAQPATSVPEQLPVEQPPMNPVPPAAVTGVAPVPLLWQQQRQGNNLLTRHRNVGSKLCGL